MKASKTVQHPFRSNRLISICVSVSILAIAVITLLTFFPSPSKATLDNDDDKDKHSVPELPIDDLPEEISITKVPVGFDRIPAAPANNPTTIEKAKLGRRLFFDPILSTDGTVSCASCHKPEHGFASPDPIAIGIRGQKGKRNAPSVLNRVFGTHFSWDGRDDSLEQQVLGPLKSETELGGDVDAVLRNIRKDATYVDAFGSVFGDEKTAPADSVTSENLAKAIACFERTLTTGNSKVDRFRASEYEALPKTARQGLWIFESRAGCWKCHSGSNLTDELFHNTGVEHGSTNRDAGRHDATKNEKHKFQYKTPSLRDVEHTAPYMHNGSIKTLREVVEFYNKGGDPSDPTLDEKMAPLNLSEKEIGFLVDFLKALSGENPATKK